jgi:two-component system, OmpR family, sensor kinase
MSATPSPATNRLLLSAWAVFAAINVAVMWLVPGEETVPFHLVWISLALVYGFTRWRMSWMITALAGVTLSTGVVLAHHAATGEIRWEETTEEPLMAAIFVVMVWHVGRRNQLVRAVEHISDLERRRAERQQLFVRLASHELRTPITVARGYTELVRAAHDDPATMEDTGIVLEELDKVARLTQRLVTLIQLEEPLAESRADIDRELSRIVRRWEPTADRRWTVESTVGDALVSLERFEAALDCLLENAVKFTRPGDSIDVCGWRTIDGWAVQVHDSGVGMPDGLAERVLNSPPGTVTTSGTGLGLAIVRTAVESRGGRLSIVAGAGRGTKVIMHLPLPAWFAESSRPMDPASVDVSATHTI